MKGTSSAQAAGDKAAHKVNQKHVELAVNRVDDFQDAWLELYKYAFDG